MKSEDQYLLSLALGDRISYFKLWNKISRSEEGRFWDLAQRLSVILKELNPKPQKNLPPNVSFISLIDEAYPADLLELPQPPIGLFFQGNLDTFRPRAAVVGSRKPVAYALRMAYRASQIWARQGSIIVSGGAVGVDAEAHRAAIDADRPTWAILGSGLLRPHPKSNENLFESILKTGGALVSEYPPYWDARPHFFPERNRLIAALSQCLFLAQAHEKSGSLGTARISLDLGREIFVLKPPAGDESFAGSQKLIELGARSLIDPQDLIRELGPGIVPESVRP